MQEYIKKYIKKIAKKILEKYYDFVAANLFPLKINSHRENYEFIFIIGCGRSGTSILGDIVNTIKGVLYFREPKDIWVKHYPLMDIWQNHDSKLLWESSDVDIEKIEKIKKYFESYAFAKRSKYIVEKQPEHAFKLDFLLSAFPSAKFINIIRSPADVALSIQTACNKDPFMWWGAKLIKKQKVSFLAERIYGNNYLQIDIKSDFEYGLLEWKLTNDLVNKFATTHPGKIITIKYEELITDPASIRDSIADFIVGRHNGVYKKKLPQIYNKMPKNIDLSLKQLRILNLANKPGS